MKNPILRMSLQIVVVALSVAASSTPAFAQFSAGVKGTAFLPNSSADGLADFDIGYGGEGFAGYRFIPNFGLEAGVGYYQSKLTGSRNFGGFGVDGKVTVSAIPLTLTAKGFLPFGDKARIYAGAGVGMYFGKVEAEVSVEILGATYSQSIKADDSIFGYHVVLGGELMVARIVGLLAEARWFKAEPEFSDFDTEKVDIAGVMISLGLLFQL